MKGHGGMKSLASTFLVSFLLSNPFCSTIVPHVSCFSVSKKLIFDQQRIQHSKLWSCFEDEVCKYFDQQPQVSYRRVDLSSIVLKPYPTVKEVGNKFIELEKKYESTDERRHIGKKNVVLLHLISSPTRLEECLPAKFQKDLTDYFNQKKDNDLGDNSNKKEYSKVIHLHRDIWDFKREIVYHRLMAQLGLGVQVDSSTNHQTYTNIESVVMRRIFARKTIVRRITSSIAMEFLDEHHLWGATKAKHNYGLFVGSRGKDGTNDLKDEELVAVATFSAKRKIVRLEKPHRSHELLRFCSKRDSNVVGGISKLIKAFVKEKSPDDIVTVVDRDWGDGSGWHSLGFHTVATMDPIVMAVCNSNEDDDPSLVSRRRHLVGAGIKSRSDIENSDDKNLKGGKSCSVKKIDRVGLSVDLLEELDSLDSIEEILGTLSRHEHFPVYDTGVERLMKVISYNSDGREIEATPSTIVDMWKNSKPTYAKEYYSPNLGIATLLKYASTTPSALPLLLNGDRTNES